MPGSTQTERIQAAQWSSSFIDSLPDSSFAFIDKDGNRSLPYKDADGKVDLPHTRNALARLNQVKGMSDEERDKVRAKLQSALKNAQAADDMVLRTTNAIQASDNDFTTIPDRVHLLRDGDFNTAKYGEVPIKAADLYEMKFNFDRGVGMAHEGETGIPIDFAHQSHLNAAGWIRGLDVVHAGDGSTELWGSNVEWSESGKKALIGKEYKCLSSDFYPSAFGEWVDAESGITAKNVIVGAALTNRPMFTGNTPVIASDGEAEATGVKTVIYVNASRETKETRMNLDQLRVKAAEDLSGAEYKFVVERQDELAAEERAKFGLKAAAEEKKAEPVQAAAVKGDEGVVAIQASELKAITDGYQAMQASIAKLTGEQQKTEHEKIEADVQAAVDRGAIKPDSKEPWVKMIEAAPGEGRELMLSNLQAMASNPLLGKTFGSEKTEGSAAMDIEAEIGKKVQERLAAAEAKGEKADAYTVRKQVLAAEPDLAKRSAEAARAVLGAFNPFEGAWGAGAKGIQNVNPEVTR